MVFPTYAGACQVNFSVVFCLSSISSDWRTSRPRPSGHEKHDWLSFPNQRVNQYEEALFGWKATRLFCVVLYIGLIAASFAWMQTV